MSAATKTRKIVQRGSAGADIPGLAQILAGAAWKRGWIMCGHDDRLMPYPTNGFNNANTAAAGGPLQVAGASADGGLRMIAKEAGVQYFQVTVGAGTAVTSIIVSDGGTTRNIAVEANISATAATVVAALRARADVMELIDVTYRGTGGAAIAGSAGGVPADVPFVRLLGLANGDVDASAEVADVTVSDPIDYPYTIRRGVLGLLPDATFALSGRKYVTDNQTVTENYAALLLPIFCDEVDDGLAFCRFE